MSIFSFFLSGIVLGFTQGCSPGPHSALVVSQTLRGSFRQGTLVAFAPVLATFPILLITIPLASFLSVYASGLGILALIGASYLFFIAFETFKTQEFQVGEMKSHAHPFWMGFNAALLSPHPYLFWSTAGATLLLGAYQAGATAAILFLVGFLGVFFLAKMILVFLSSRLKSGIQGKGFIVLMRSLSALLAIFAVMLCLDGFKLLGVSL